MSTTAIWTMVVICGFIWGTFLLLAWRAWRWESRKDSRR